MKKKTVLNQKEMCLNQIEKGLEQKEDAPLLDAALLDACCLSVDDEFSYSTTSTVESTQLTQHSIYQRFNIR